MVQIEQFMCFSAPDENALSAASGHARRSEELLPRVYEELRRLAAHRVATMAPGQTLQATALVHEAWLRLARKQEQWTSRTHFLATAAEMMRHILIDHLRGKARLKRGGGRLRLNIDGLEIPTGARDDKVLLIEEALQLLEKEQPEKARVVVLKFFGGLTDREAAEVLGVTERTIERHWAYAKAWLFRAIRENNNR